MFINHSIKPESKEKLVYYGEVTLPGYKINIFVIICKLSENILGGQNL